MLTLLRPVPVGTDCSATYIGLPSLLRLAGTMSISPFVGLVLGVSASPSIVAFSHLSQHPSPVFVLL